MEIAKIEGNGKEEDLVNRSKEGHQVQDETEQGRRKYTGKIMLAESMQGTRNKLCKNVT